MTLWLHSAIAASALVALISVASAAYYTRDRLAPKQDKLVPLVNALKIDQRIMATSQPGLTILTRVPTEE